MAASRLPALRASSTGHGAGLLSRGRPARGRASGWPRDWMAGVAATVQQESLLDTRSSLASLRGLTRPAPPRAVFVGVGLCTRTQLSQALPLDLLGMLLPAERIRRAAGASTLVVLVADEHAFTNAFEPLRVERCVQATMAGLARLRRACGLDHMTVVRASAFHQGERYRAVLAEARRRIPERAHAYVERQIADVEYLDRVYGGILKVGWVREGAHRGVRRDEVAFDRLARACFGSHVGFVYCKPGRALADGARKAPPYISVEPRRRICLDPGEDPGRKLAEARAFASEETINGVRRHLRRLVYAYDKHVDGLSGRLEERVESMITRVCAAAPQAAAQSKRFA